MSGRAVVEQILELLDSRGERVAITVDDPDAGAETWTHRDVLHRVRREARRLDGRGVAHGDVVAIMTGDRPVSLVLRWAVNAVGGVFVAIGDGYATPAVTHLLSTLSVRWVLVDASRRERAEAAVEGTGAVVVDLDAAAPWRSP